MEGGDLLPLCVLISPLASNPANILISVKGLFFLGKHFSCKMRTETPAVLCSCQLPPGS